MGYVGNQSSSSFNSITKQDLTGASGSSLTLTSPVANANEIELFINHVRQEPTTSYTASGTTITLQGYTVVAADDIYVIYLGKGQQTVVTPDGSVTSAKLGAGVVHGLGIFKGDTSQNLGAIIRVHENELNTNTTIDANTNGIASGPLTIASGVTLTITSGGALSIV
jgi:hypothetical protein